MLKKDYAKIACLAIFAAGMVGILLTDNQFIRTARGFAEGPPQGHTGAPLELTCAVSGCHTGTPNSGRGQLTITVTDPATSDEVTRYEPGKTYQVSVKHASSESSRRRWGFQLTVLAANETKAGDLENANSTTQVLDGGPGGNRQYIEHSDTGTFQSFPSPVMWIFKWTAPASRVGTITLYAAGNQANNDGNSTGDQIYTTTLSLKQATSGPPVILNAVAKGKKLLVSGENFDEGATLLMNGSKVKKVSNDSDNPDTLIVAKKAGKEVKDGDVLTVKNSDGTVSNEFVFKAAQ